jgi:hypothetical protein
MCGLLLALWITLWICAMFLEIEKAPRLPMPGGYVREAGETTLMSLC